MAWQHLYGEMSDEGTDTIKQTSSRRGINRWIAGEIKTTGKGGWSWKSQHTQGKEVVPKIDLRRVKMEHRDETRREHENLIREKTVYRHEILMDFASDQEFYVNGVLINEDKLRQLEA